MKKAFKILTFVLVFTLALMPMLSLAAPDFFEATPDDSIKGEMEQFGNLTNKALYVIQFIGYAIAVVMILVLGVQWMLATPAKKAELKGKMWSMAIGILLLVGGVTILGWVWDTAGTIGG